MKNRMIILDTLGNVIHEINEDVRRYDWSPDGSKIVFITGTWWEKPRYNLTGYWNFDSLLWQIHSPFCVLLALSRLVRLTASPISVMAAARIINTRNTRPNPVPPILRASPQSTPIPLAPF